MLQSLEQCREVAQSVFVAKLLKHEIDVAELVKISPLTRLPQLIYNVHFCKMSIEEAS